MEKIIPTIFASSASEFRERFFKLIKIAPALQIDFMDGKFVPAKSMPVSAIPDLRKYQIAFEAHLMVAKPEEWIQEIAQKKFKKIIVHIEAIKNIDRGLDLFHRIRTAGAEPMLAINPETSMERLEPFLTKVEGILVMGVHPGKEHQELAANTLRRVAMLHNRGIVVQVDGGVNNKTINALIAAGVDVVNVGSFIAEAEDPKKAYKEIVDAFKKERYLSRERFK